ncbi:MAG: cupin domain-containing protein [Actinobacteria bacterium]|nr:cupin domain-containing protein [Actinomycetota bacterium]
MSAFDDVRSLVPRQVWAGITARAVHGERLTLAVVELEPGAVAEEHSHEHEQLGIVLRGSIRFRVGAEERELGPGETWEIPSNTRHRAEAGADGAIVLDLFAPPRSEWEAAEPAEPGEPGPGLWP